jgi:ATP phosphoribosyltransferase
LKILPVLRSLNCITIGTGRMEQRTPVIDKDTFWDVIDQLKEAGAEGYFARLRENGALRF